MTLSWKVQKSKALEIFIFQFFELDICFHQFSLLTTFNGFWKEFVTFFDIIS